jgi:hypothetical protein
MVASNCNDGDKDEENNPSATNSLAHCQELVSTVQNDQSELTKMLSFVNQTIDKYGKGNQVAP